MGSMWLCGLHATITVAICYCLQKHAKYVESGLKAVKARNEYILCLEAANAAVQKYFSDDIHDLINVSILQACTYTVSCFNVSSFFCVMRCLSLLQLNKFCLVFTLPANISSCI